MDNPPTIVFEVNGIILKRESWQLTYSVYYAWHYKVKRFTTLGSWRAKSNDWTSPPSDYQRKKYKDIIKFIETYERLQ